MHAAIPLVPGGIGTIEALSADLRARAARLLGEQVGRE